MKFKDGITHLVVGSAIEDIQAAGALERDQIRAETKKQVKAAANTQARATIFGASTLGSRVYLFSFSPPFPWRESLPLLEENLRARPGELLIVTWWANDEK
jgi:hypothetical protein